MLSKNKKIYFSKMHGLGNDFVVIDKINQNIPLSKNIIKKISNRNTGIGFDQLLIVENPKKINCDFYYRIFNADGSEVAQCGNGARCFVYFLHLKKLTTKKKILVQTKYNDMLIHYIDKKNIIVNMGHPKFNSNNVPKFKLKNFNLNVIKINDIIIEFGTIFIGNPHCIILVKDINNCSVKKIGRLLNNHILFPEGINVNFVQIVSLNHIMLRVYERGVGETRACGSGACASVVHGIIQNILQKKVIVTLLGGNLEIFWSGFGDSVYMKGPAEHVYDGYIDINCFET